MYFIRKLKPKQLSTELIPVLILLPIILIVFTVWGMRAGWGVIAAVELAVVIMHLNMFFRTRNSSFLWLASAFLLIVIFALYISVFGMRKEEPGFTYFAIAAIISFIVMAYIILTKRIKWRTREMLELAAMPVGETGDGFTERPFSLGYVDASNDEIESFARFLYKNLVALPHRADGKVIFSLSNSYLKQNGFKSGYEDESWVSFGDDGSVDVFISRKDYLLYNETYSFDQLCQNLGRLFMQFFELFRKGEGCRIIDRLNALDLNPITE